VISLRVYGNYMQQSLDDEGSMDEALAAIRGVFAEEDASETTSTRADVRSSGKSDSAKRTPQAGLLSREASDAVGLTINKLTENVKKHQPPLEEVVREALRPMLKSWVDENLHDVVERMVRPEIERAIRGR
jgi:cell pole-organizing protein PopZ